MRKDDLGKYLEIRQQTVDVPEWGGSITVKGMALKPWLELVSKFQEEGEDKQTVMFEMVAASVFDEVGERLFDTVEEVSRLPAKHFSIVTRLFETVSELNGEPEEEEKN